MSRKRLSHKDVSTRLEGTGVYWVSEYGGSNKKSTFGCFGCGHEWKAIPAAVFNGSRCPMCYTREKRGRGHRADSNGKVFSENEILEDHGDYLVLDISTPSSSGESMLIDREDFDRLKEKGIGRISFSAYGYARCRIEGRVCLVHRAIMELNKELDHINRDKLDNRRANLRAVESWQNQANRGMRKTNTSGIIGVDFHKDRWRAQLVVRGKTVLNKKFKTKEEAALAIAEARREHRGDYAPKKC